MLLIHCPFCGARPEVEFAYAGQAHRVRALNPSDVSDAQWTDYLYERVNTRGVHAERWYHNNGCGRFFNALRDTTTDKFLATYQIGQPKPELVKGLSA